MRLAATLTFLTLASVPAAMAAGSDSDAGVKEQEFGRVFMSRAERRQLDLLRMARPPSQPTATPRQEPLADNEVRTKKSEPAGYIVPSNGRPYQWVDGDFRRATRAEVESTIMPRTVSITRHENGADRDDRSVKPEDPAAIEREPTVNEEGENVHPGQQ